MKAQHIGFVLQSVGDIIELLKNLEGSKKIEEETTLRAKLKKCEMTLEDIRKKLDVEIEL